MKKTIDIIAGARPNFVKIAPIIRELHKYNKTISVRLVHTGQHYDPKLSMSFFEQLQIPHPDINLNVGSGSQAEQTGLVMKRYEDLLVSSRSDLCLVVGDVNSTVACAIVAQKLHVPVAHVEAGIRSGDWSMPEEINRLVTDAITNWFFTTSEIANENLRKAGVEDNRVFFVGNTMIDTLLSNFTRLRPPNFWHTLALKDNEFFVLTLHRPGNVDNVNNFKNLITMIGNDCLGFPVIFPAHPRTSNLLKSISPLPKNIKIVEPQSYLEFNFLLKNSRAVITDSGGVTEEATVLGVPCMTLRDSTERPETVSLGTNELVGSNPHSLAQWINILDNKKWKKGCIPDKWDGNAGERIAEILAKLV